MEYEILEAAFAKAGAELNEKRDDLDDANRKIASLEAAAVLEARERETLREQLRAFEGLSARREDDERETRARARDAAAALAERDAELRCARDELVLERDLLAAVRQQVEAAEAERASSAAQLAVYRRRLGSAGLLSPEEASEAARSDADAAAPSSWEGVLEQRAAALHALLPRARARAGLAPLLRVPRFAPLLVVEQHDDALPELRPVRPLPRALLPPRLCRLRRLLHRRRAALLARALAHGAHVALVRPAPHDQPRRLALRAPPARAAQAPPRERGAVRREGQRERKGAGGGAPAWGPFSGATREWRSWTPGDPAPAPRDAVSKRRGQQAPRSPRGVGP